VLLDGTAEETAVLIAIVRRTRLSAGIAQEGVRIQKLVPQIPVGFAVIAFGALLEHHSDLGRTAELGIQGAAGNSKLLQGVGGGQRDQSEAVSAGPPAVGSVLHADAIQIPIVASPV